MSKIIHYLWFIYMKMGGNPRGIFRCYYMWPKSDKNKNVLKIYGHVHTLYIVKKELKLF